MSSYCVFCETNLQYLESWYTFIKKEGNEIALRSLQKQLDEVVWDTDPDSGHFQLDLENTVTPASARQMIHIDLGNKFFHQKFDGLMKEVDLKISKKDKDRVKVRKANRVLQKNGIRRFLEAEDLTGCDDFNSDYSYDSHYTTDFVGSPREQPETKNINEDDLPQLLKNK